MQAYDRGKKQNIVTIDTALPETGIIQAGNKLEAEVKSWFQTGGMVKTGKGGAKIAIEREAQINALRETSVLQANRCFSVAPSFTPAYMISDGNQEITVTEGGFVVSGISSLAAGSNSVNVRDGIHFMPKMEEYELPEQRVGRGFNKKTMGGTSTSSLHNEFMAGHDAKLESKEANVSLYNTLLAAGKKLI